MKSEEISPMNGQETGQRAPIPKLRFPEFREADKWKIEPLRALARRLITKNTDNSHTRVLTNSAEHGVLDQREYFEKDIATQENLEGYYVVEKGDYVYNPRISANAPVGPISRNNLGTGVMSPLYTVFRFDGGGNDFFVHYFKSTYWHHYMRQSSSTGARHDRMSITNNDFMGLPLPVPQVEEQQKIADCLSSIDELISAEARKLDALKAHKKGLMQQLFPAEGETVPRLRFPEFRDAGEWSIENLGELSIVVRGGSPRPIDGYLTTAPNGLNWLKIGDVDKEAKYVDKTQEKVRPEALSKTREVHPGDLILSNSMSFGRPYLMRIKSCIHDGWIALTEIKEKVSREYLYYFFFASASQSYFLNNAAGSGVLNLNAEIIKALPVVFPSLTEQQRIIDCLSSFDDLIVAQNKEIEFLKWHKKGLMQQLFPVMDEMQE